ncbi:ATP-binding cassette domain-containing protein [Chelatococcus sp. YT9]|uniref:ABC transporter ATP-binding protein n=1 Tax=unclassified Chelatococcus TaxID=2638111 RepID=UPI001BCDCB97|nr:ATP-binding cassette domain-containing protein [Chelatococcus sp. YT9]MBX3557656.1 ATP-binding cassette domain-containing protein [Chelatococcus sp.]
MAEQFDIELSHCRKRYGELNVLDDVSLQVRRGEFITVLGPSGCGKTTTLRAIGGFMTPDSGRISIRGREVTHLPPYKRNIGVVFQNYALWPHMTVAEILGFGLRIRKLPREEITRRVDRALGMVQLTGLKDRYPRELSGGQQQRVAMARALAIDPEVIILDEPLSNLDRRLREELRIELKRLQRSLGVTMLFVTHDQEEALSMSDQVVVMQSGRIQQIADPRTVYERPANRFVAGFLGAPTFSRASWLATRMMTRLKSGSPTARSSALMRPWRKRPGRRSPLSSALSGSCSNGGATTLSIMGSRARWGT